MNELKLMTPHKAHKEAVMAYKQAFIDSGDSMDGTAGLQSAETFEEWLKAVQDNSKEETVRDGLVPSSTFLAVEVESGEIIGMIDIRHRLNDYLKRCGGHIGYSVRKSQRRKGYASHMLKLALEECKALGIQDVLITCNKENIASAKTILANGGVLENEIQENARITQRYYIHI